MNACHQFLDKFKPDFEWKIASKSQKGQFHTVSYFQKTNKWECDCPAGGFKAQCRHIRVCQNKLQGIKS
jgi:hypothetical protein